jgi:hypothetical protein
MHEPVTSPAEEGIYMAKYDVTYTCGHTGVIQLVGPGSKREWLLAREQEKLCPDCFQEKLKADREKENAEAAEKNQAAGLPQLEGTEKQIAWAETIRAHKLEYVAENTSFSVNRLPGVIAKHKANGEIDKATEIQYEYERLIKALELLRLQDQASWWINHRGDNTEQILSAVLADYDKEQAVVDTDESLEAKIEAEAEATVYPENATTNLVAEIIFEGSTIEVNYPERNETLRELMRKLDFKWNGSWNRKYDKMDGAIQDRAAEIGNRLLSLGFPVRIYNEEIRQKAISGEYEPEPRGGVYARTSGRYEGWLEINWKQPFDYFNAAHSIRGARWDKPSMVVPPENYDEVLDFVQVHGFSISEKAQAIIDAAKRARENALVTGVKPPSTKLPEPGTKPATLDVPQEVKIDDEFRDEN